MDEQTRYAVKVRAPDHAEPEWASLLAARIAPLLDASAVEVVTALVNHAPIAPDSSFEDAERLVVHLRTLGVTGVLVERPVTMSRRADVADRGTLKGLLPIPSETPEKGRNTQPFMFTTGPQRTPSSPSHAATIGGRTEPPRGSATGGYGGHAANGEHPGGSLGSGGRPAHAPGASAPRQPGLVHGPPRASPQPISTGQWGAAIPARIQDRSTKPGSPTPAPTQGWEFGGDMRPKTDSYHLEGQQLASPPHRQTQRLPEPETGEADTTHWTPIAPDPGTFGWPPGGHGHTAGDPQSGYPNYGSPMAGPPLRDTDPHSVGAAYRAGAAGPPSLLDGRSKSRSNRPTPAMPEMAAPQPINPAFQGPSSIYMPTSGPRPAIPSAEVTDPLSHDPGMAALLSTFLPGMGQVYNGQRDRGIVFALTALFVVPWIVGIVDAWHQAASIRRGEQPVPDALVWRSARWSQLVLDIAVFTAILVAVDLWVGSKGVLRSPPAPPVSAPLHP